MKDKKTRLNYWQIASIGLGAVVIVAVLGTAVAVKADNGGFWDNVAGKLAQILSGRIEDPGSQVLGGSTSDNWNVGGNLTVAGTSAFTGAITATGGVTGPLTTSNLSTAVTTTTLATTDSGKVYNITSSTKFVLPSTSTNAGVWYRFAIGGAITSNVTIQTSDGGNDIEGAMIVAGAVVDCDAEDTITFVADGENIGDYIELYGNGTDWLIGSSGALTSGKMTCSTST
jgi:hypothetical protein